MSNPGPPRKRRRMGMKRGRESQRAGLDRGLEAIPGQKEKMRCSKVVHPVAHPVASVSCDPHVEAEDGQCTASHVSSGAIYAESGPL